MSSEHDAELNMLLWYQKQYEKGDKSALLEAIEHCAMCRLVMPDWVVSDYVFAFRSWSRLKVKTLDDAFGVAKPKGFRIEVAKEEMYTATAVYMEIIRLERQGFPIHQDGAIAEVCEKFHINRDKAWKYYKLARETIIGSGLDEVRKKSKKL